MSAKGPGKGTVTIHRLLEERRKYESWLARIRSATDATSEQVRVRVEADYTARLRAVNEELKIHAEAARTLMAERRGAIAELRSKEQRAAERLAEGELRHAVGEYDEEQWTLFRKEVLGELVTVREQLQELEGDLRQFEEVTEMVTAPSTPPPAAPPSPQPERLAPKAGPPPRPPVKTEPKKVDELAFIKSVTEDERRGPSARRASGGHYQPSEPQATKPPGAGGAVEESPISQKTDSDTPRTLKCPECGTMNMPTEWYCEQCGAELAAL